MINLLSNAIKYSPIQSKIAVKTEIYKDTFLKISVIDEGMGIREEDQQAIFSEFYQTDHVRDEAMGGTGIGLALTKRLVDMHGGEIGLESEFGKGSTFWFTLPLGN